VNTRDGRSGGVNALNGGVNTRDDGVNSRDGGVNALDGAAGDVDALARIFYERVAVREEAAKASRARARAVARQEAEQRRVKEEAEAEAREQAAAAAERAVKAEAVRAAVTAAAGMRAEAGAVAGAAVAEVEDAVREAEAFTEEGTLLLAADSGAGGNGAPGAEVPPGLRARVGAARRRLSASVLSSASDAVDRAFSLLDELQAALLPPAVAGELEPPEGGWASAEGGWGSAALLKAVGPVAAGEARRAGELAAEAETHALAVTSAASLLDRTTEDFQRLCEALDEVAPPSGIPAGPPGEATLSRRELRPEEEERVEEALVLGGDESKVLAEYENVPVRDMPHPGIGLITLPLSGIGPIANLLFGIATPPATLWQIMKVCQ
jgi:hypothetical protein